MKTLKITESREWFAQFLSDVDKVEVLSELDSAQIVAGLAGAVSISNHYFGLPRSDYSPESKATNLKSSFAHYYADAYTAQFNEIYSLLDSRKTNENYIVARSLHCHLLLEYKLTQLIETFRPGVNWELLFRGSSIGFDAKLKIARTLEIQLPSFVIDTMSEMNRLRNQIAHDVFLKPADLDTAKLRELARVTAGEKFLNEKEKHQDVITWMTQVSCAMISSLLIAEKYNREEQRHKNDDVAKKLLSLLKEPKHYSADYVVKANLKKIR